MEALKAALERMIVWVFIGSLVLDTFDKHPDKSLSEFSVSYKLAMLFFVSIRWGAIGYSVYSGVGWWALIAILGDLIINFRNNEPYYAKECDGGYSIYRDSFGL
jgi:hypothetical protein